MERMSPGAVDTNAFSNMVTRLQQEHNDTHPGWQNVGGDVRMGRFEYIPDKVVPCGLTARRHHGTKKCFKFALALFLFVGICDAPRPRGTGLILSSSRIVLSIPRRLRVLTRAGSMRNVINNS